MASSSISITLPPSFPIESILNPPFLKPLSLPKSKRTVVKNPNSKPSNNELGIQATLMEKAVIGLTAITLETIMVFLRVAQVVGNNFSLSLKNFLLSIVAGGVMLEAVFGDVISIANFDPVKKA